MTLLSRTVVRLPCEVICSKQYQWWQLRNQVTKQYNPTEGQYKQYTSSKVRDLTIQGITLEAAAAGGCAGPTESCRTAAGGSTIQTILASPSANTQLLQRVAAADITMICASPAARTTSSSHTSGSNTGSTTWQPGQFDKTERSCSSKKWQQHHPRLAAHTHTPRASG